MKSKSDLQRNHPFLPSAEVIQVIRTCLTTRGKGTSDDPIRRIQQFWALDGTLLSEDDPLTPLQADNSALLKDLNQWKVLASRLDDGVRQLLSTILNNSDVQYQTKIIEKLKSLIDEYDAFTYAKKCEKESLETYGG